MALKCLRPITSTRPDLVIGSDTVVALDDTILEKPADMADAARMLLGLSGRSHTVYSGVALLFPGGADAAAAPIGLNTSRYETVPQTQLNGRKGFQPRGRVLGGSTSINAMVYTRGAAAD